jgi:hypothetical protein
MLLFEARDKLQKSLGDTSEVYFNEDTLDRAICRAVEEISRYYPLKTTKEYIFTKNIVGEEIEFDANDEVTLEHKPVDYESDTVKSKDGKTTYVRGTDYNIYYHDGKLELISDGSMSSGVVYKINYSLAPNFLDISDVSTEIYKINKLVCLGYVPEKQVSFDYWNKILYLPQNSLSTADHLLIYYETTHTPPGITTEGTYSKALDEVMLEGAQGFALWIKALELSRTAEQDAQNTISLLAGIEKYLTGDTDSAKKALEIVMELLQAEHMTEAYEMLVGDTDSAKAALKAVDDYYTPVDNEMNEEEKYLVGDGVNIRGAEDYIQSGDDYIDSVNIGGSVPELYSRYSETEIRIAQEYSARAQRIMQKCELNNRQADGRINIARALGEMGSTYYSIAGQYIGLVNGLMALLNHRVAVTRNSFEISNKLLTIAAELIKSFRNALASQKGINIPIAYNSSPRRGSFSGG